MRIGMVGRKVTYSGKYAVNWGLTGNAYNRNSKSFSSRKKAISFKNKLTRKYKPKYKVNYMYLAN